MVRIFVISMQLLYLLNTSGQTTKLIDDDTIVFELLVFGYQIMKYYTAPNSHLHSPGSIHDTLITYTSSPDVNSLASTHHQTQLFPTQGRQCQDGNLKTRVQYLIQVLLTYT